MRGKSESQARWCSEGELVFDADKPAGTLRKLQDVSRMEVHRGGGRGSAWSQLQLKVKAV